MKRVYWFGYGGSSKLLDPLRPIIKELNIELIEIHEWPHATIKWELETWLNELKKADIIIIPANFEVQPCKSNTRLTQALSLGKPVICSPLDSYVRILNEYPGSFLIARNLQEWDNYLTTLRDNIELCKSLSEKAVIASKKYSIEEITKKWISVLDHVECIDIIIPTYNNVEYLKMCLDSIKLNSSKRNNIIISDAGSNEATWQYYSTLSDIKIIGEKGARRNFSQTCNLGVQNSSSDYFVILNSDVIVSKNWDSNLLEKMQADQNLGICGVLSNCDKFWLHGVEEKPNYPMSIPGLDLIPGMKAIQLEGRINDLYNFMDNSNKSHQGTLVNQEWVAFYATMFNRKIFNEVGLLDPGFANGCEDLDFSIRLRNMVYNIAQAIDSFIFHFGGITRGHYENERKEQYHEEDRLNHAYLKEKRDRKTIVLFSGQSFEKWDYRSIDQGGIGGSEANQVYMAKELSNLGYRVLCFNDCEAEINDGLVKYIPFEKIHEYAEYNWFDYFISYRTTEVFRLNIRAGKKFVFIHDIWLSNKNEILYKEKVNKFFVLSEWHRDFVSQHHNIPLDRLFMTSNGIDIEKFKNKNIERNPYRLHWSSSLDRGLDTLLYLFDFIKLNVPEVELHIFYGIDNWLKVAQYRPEEKAKIEALQAAMNKPGVFYHGRIGQEQLAEEELKASLWCYPTDFEETYCITAVECQAAGLPVIASNYAGLRTTIGDSGILLGSGQKNESLTRDFRVEFVKKCVELLKNKDMWNLWSQKSLENAKNRTWKNVAAQWGKEILK